MITLYMKNRLRDNQPCWCFLRVISQRPLQILGYRVDPARTLIEEPVDPSFMRKFGGWYHPATAWEREQFKQLGGVLEA